MKRSLAIILFTVAIFSFGMIRPYAAQAAHVYCPPPATNDVYNDHRCMVPTGYYFPEVDPLGKCITAGGEGPSQSCLQKYYPNGISQYLGSAPGQNYSYFDPRCVSAARPAECKAAAVAGQIDQYNDDICLSPYSVNDAQVVDHVDDSGQPVYMQPQLTQDGKPMYNSDTCKSERGKATCDKKRDQGFVYTYVLGGDPEQSCYDFTGVIKVLMDYAMLIAAIICGFMFLRGGIGYTVSKGNPAALMEARDQILHATIGLVIIMLAFVIVQFLQGSLGFLGVNLVGPFGYLGGT